MTFRLVLDATAVIAYSKGSIAVGEILAEVADECDWSDPENWPHIAVPIPALDVAHRDGADLQQLDLLCGLRHVMVTTVVPGDWRRVVNASRMLGGLDRACAALLAAYGRADLILTADPGPYAGLDTIGI